MRRKHLEGRSWPSRERCRSPDDRCSSSHFTVRFPRFLLFKVMGKELMEWLCTNLGTSVQHSPIKSCLDKSSYSLAPVKSNDKRRISLRICVIDNEAQFLNLFEFVR